MRIQCPSCGAKREVEAGYEWRPFCSRRCKMVDLGNWLGEVYKLSRPLRVDDLSDDQALLSQLMVNAEE